MSSERDERMEKKLDLIIEKVHAIDKTLAGQHVSLKEHIRRTDLLEDQIYTVDEKIAPLQGHVAVVQGVIKTASFLAIFVGAILGILKALGKL